MSDSKKFFELVSRDESVKAELQKAIDEATAKVAEAHGFKLNELENLDVEELSAVAGGKNGKEIIALGIDQYNGDILKTGQHKGASFTC